jgi:hypothetical protein
VINAVPINRNRLVDLAPTTLSEAYYTCTASSYDAFTNAVGIAFADTGALVTVMPVLFIPIIYFALKV